MPDTTTGKPVDKRLAHYPEHIQAAIRSEAHTWFRNHVEPAADMYDSQAAWARLLTPEQRRSHSAGAWYANQPLKRAAIGEVQRELGDPTD
ncbi:hypothetical protein ACFRKE_38075 [Kitasatospora indigofera]|uniref:hypothetical protein n=1 Tax=Kitasatospora indigofera TaxID=67307 RepID=UPI00367F2404